MKGLIDAHQKLSDYYQTFDKSLFYIWSCMSNFIFKSSLWVSHCSLFAVLDPHISYKAMKDSDEFKNDSDLVIHLETANKTTYINLGPCLSIHKI